jgi:hypothetical protein
MRRKKHYIISNIKYDEGHSDLPPKLNLMLDEGLTDEEVDEAASEFISNETGFCHKGFDLNKA